MRDNDSFRLFDPDEAVVIISAIFFFIALSPLTVSSAPEPKRCTCEATKAEAAHLAKIVVGSLNGQQITIDGKPAAVCRPIRSKT